MLSCKATMKLALDNNRQSPGEIKSREVELGSQSRMDRLAAELFLNS